MRVTIEAERSESERITRRNKPWIMGDWKRNKNKEVTNNSFLSKMLKVEKKEKCNRGGHYVKRVFKKSHKIFNKGQLSNFTKYQNAHKRFRLTFFRSKLLSFLCRFLGDLFLYGAFVLDVSYETFGASWQKNLKEKFSRLRIFLYARFLDCWELENMPFMFLKVSMVLVAFAHFKIRISDSLTIRSENLTVSE